MLRRFSWLLVIPLLLTGVNCNQIMGIEDAHVDENFLEDEPVASAGSIAGGAHGQVEAAGTESMTSSGSSGDPADSVGGDDSGGTTSISNDGGEAGAPEPAAGETSAEAGATGGEDPQEPAPPLCDQYCEQVMKYCTGDLEQYRDIDQCLTVCEIFPEGQVGDDGINSVTCRMKYVGNARYGSGTELAAYCRQAGPGGDGRCGDNCEGYCSVMMSVCTEEVSNLYRYETEQDCLEECRTLPDSEAPYSTKNPVISDGNHVECRLFHVTSAAMLDAEEHCEHAMGVTLCEPVPANPSRSNKR